MLSFLVVSDVCDVRSTDLPSSSLPFNDGKDPGEMGDENRI